jgi:hypothetical protein
MLIAIDMRLRRRLVTAKIRFVPLDTVAARSTEIAFEFGLSALIADARFPSPFYDPSSRSPTHSRLEYSKLSREI